MRSEELSAALWEILVDAQSYSLRKEKLCRLPSRLVKCSINKLADVRLLIHFSLEKNSAVYPDRTFLIFHFSITFHSSNLARMDDNQAEATQITL
jgi:hypothetical protein